ncbi:MAG: YeeE/YedE family protein [Saprospiraceae bacterium]|nr:YeeE/YedE family protein [Saprospiraceae bacterium]
MLQWLSQPWPWYVAGPLIGLTVPLLLLLGNKQFGISSSLRHVCAACFPAGIDFFKYDWKHEIWNLVFVAGLFLGGLLAATLLKNPEPIQIADATKLALSELGVQDFQHLLPSDIFGWEHILSAKGIVFFILGGFLVGFGTRYAGGCTSGHSIMGLSTFQLSSLVATIFFMVGGFITTHLLLPLFLN